jgi:hypothetical protein
MRSGFGWYARRIQRMSPAEVAWRIEDSVRKEVWAHRRFGPAPLSPTPGGASGGNRTTRVRRSPPMPDTVDLRAVPPQAIDDLLSTAEGILGGRVELLGVSREDMADPVWSLDPSSGKTFPVEQRAFRIDYRSAPGGIDVKGVWELSRHQYLTVLACAWRASGDERYASMAARHLRSWWAANPVLSGVNWASGIELGIRLISWAWTRRLLDGWPDAQSLFEENRAAVDQIYWHQRYLAAFRSRGSSANNHAIAEAAGQLVGTCAFPWFEESARWQREAARRLETVLAGNTFSSGLNREQAFEYHGFVAELGLAAAAECQAAGAPLGQGTWEILCRMVDVTAAVLDRSGGAPRYGDGDDGRGLVLNGSDTNRWSSLLATGAAIFGRLPWWPTTTPDLQSVLLSALVGRVVHVSGRPAQRRSHFPDAGLTILRTAPGAPEELWCRCDAGPHGFLSIAAHAHADACSIELRHDGVEILADPGTYSYFGAPSWRRYFRSTVGHNTLEVDGQDQSVSGGPFLWMRHARARVVDVAVDDDGTQHWSAVHTGYTRLSPPVRHLRTVTLNAAARSFSIIDLITSTGVHTLRLVFHLGPLVVAELCSDHATLTWESHSGNVETAILVLPASMEWHVHRGEVSPPLGWYAPKFGRKQPATTVVGTAAASDIELRTELRLTS